MTGGLSVFFCGPTQVQCPPFGLLVLRQAEDFVLRHGEETGVAANTSKTARASVSGKTLHLATGSEAFTEAVKALAAAGHGAKIKAEIEGLAAKLPAEQGWDTTLKTLEEADAFAAEAVAA
jgi:hypothetical protein